MDIGTVEPDRLYTLYEVWELTRASYTNCRRWVNAGKQRASRLGDMLVVCGSDLLQTLAEYEAGKIELEAPRFGSIRQLVAAK